MNLLTGQNAPEQCIRIGLPRQKKRAECKNQVLKTAEDTAKNGY